MLRRSRAGRAVVGSNRARERFGRIGALGVFAEHRTHDRYDRASASDLVRVGPSASRSSPTAVFPCTPQKSLRGHDQAGQTAALPRVS
jgi:hypothetical protein